MTANASLTDELMGQLQGAPMQGLAQQLHRLRHRHQFQNFIPSMENDKNNTIK
jgi:hypothetical protein